MPAEGPALPPPFVAGQERRARVLAAAVAALYGVLLSAFALGGLLSKTATASGVLALTAVALALSLRHGLAVAIVGFVGGFVSPAVIGVENPNTPVLFGYLFAIVAGTLCVVRYRGWWKLGVGVLLGAVLWVIAWIRLEGEGWVWVVLFLLASCALFAWATWRRFR